MNDPSALVMVLCRGVSVVWPIRWRLPAFASKANPATNNPIKRNLPFIFVPLKEASISPDLTIGNLISGFCFQLLPFPEAFADKLARRAGAGFARHPF